MDKEMLKHMIDIKERLAKIETRGESTHKITEETKEDFQVYRREIRAQLAAQEEKIDSKVSIKFMQWGIGLLLGMPSVAYAAAKLLGLL